MSNVPSDIAIAQAAKLRPIAEVAAEVGLAPEEILPYGRHKAKISAEARVSQSGDSTPSARSRSNCWPRE